MRTYWNIGSGLKQLNGWQAGCWTQITCPDADDLHFLEKTLKVPSDFIDASGDFDERARYDTEDDWTLIILRIPYDDIKEHKTPLTTVPLGMLLNKESIITVCSYPTEMMKDFINYQTTHRHGFIDSTDLVFRLFLSSSVWYLKYLRLIGARIEEAKRKIDGKISNQDLLNLSRLQDSLTFFITSLRGNEGLLQKLRYKLPVDELDADLIDDVNIEMSQARETTEIYDEILDSTMDTYANVINNGMNVTMKKMTSASIILMFPTLVASVFGMNLLSGLEEKWWSFPVIIVGTAAITVLIWQLFKHNEWI